MPGAAEAGLRAALIDAFLAGGPGAGARRAHLAGDASNRRYERLLPEGAAPLVLMDAPPEKGEDVRPFVDVTARLRRIGLSAPEIRAQDPRAGLLLLEDLGDALYARVLEGRPDDEAMLYAAAVDLLAALHRLPQAAEGLPPYDAAVYRRESALATDWYLPAATGRATAAPLRAAYLDLIEAACAPHAVRPPVCVLRDYHAENLVWLPERAGDARVGLLDYQDALAGHPAYDLVSLLEDARRDTSEALRQAMIARYLAASDTAPEAFRAAYAALGAQRNLKIVGIFARLWLRDGKPQYLSLIPRVWAHVQRDLGHPDLAALRAFVAAHLPPPTAEVLARLRAARSG
ncbi:phosphotransferase [Rhodobacteraceae bacterium 2CG4]|uniref:Phosphotransferase n=2 Tax=Halovulum marinum TaxID=2662447 RepID=A0A6L5Z0D2_9RHOB|nr:phosphotransferase [Halovulum marinum]